MAQERTLPDKYYGENGIHRVPTWRVAGFALNNLSTNLYLMLMGYVAYYLVGFVGVATVLASSIAMYMRLWDGVTDPLIGVLVDRTDGRFGKNRPFMVIGNLILCVMSFIMYHVTHLLPESVMIRLPFFIVCELVYYIGYTFQCVVTKSAQSCLTNDPKQRPLFALFDKIYLVALSTLLSYYIVYLSSKYGTFYSTGLFHDLWLVIAISSFLCMVVACISIAPKDRTEFYGTGKKQQKIGLRDYWDTLKNNRAIQMLVVAASTDKLASQMHTSSVNIVLFGIVVGNYSIYATMNAMISIPNAIIAVLLIGVLATKLGQRKGLIIGSIGAMIGHAGLILLWIFGDPTTLTDGTGVQWGYFAVLYIILMLITQGFQGLSGQIVIPMTADCADYEVYRTGKYVPGLIGTLFSLVDKLISAFGPFLVGLMFAAVGYADALPDLTSPYSDSLFYMSVFLMYGTSLIGLAFNLIAMKFYPLTKEKMEEIQDEITAIKAAAMQEEA